MGIAILCMVNSTALAQNGSLGGHKSAFHNASLKINHDNDTSRFCLLQDELSKDNTKAARKTPEGEFIWSKAEQGLVLSAFFYGYILTQVNKGSCLQKEKKTVYSKQLF